MTLLNLFSVGFLTAKQCLEIIRDAVVKTLKKFEAKITTCIKFHFTLWKKSQ